MLSVPAILLSMVLVQDAQSTGSPRPSMPYDEFFALTDRDDRVRVFNEITAENKATLVRTHLERWLNRNRARLSAEQVAMMEEFHRIVTPELYGLPKKAEVQAKVSDLAERTRKLFSPTDVAQALTIQADRIAADPAPSR